MTFKTEHNNELGNRILLALSHRVRAELMEHVTGVDLEHGWTICRPDTPLRDLYFIDQGVVSLIKRMKNGEAVEIGARGIEGITAPETLIGITSPLYEAVVQIPGFAYAIPKTVLQKQVEKHRELRDLLLGYIHASSSQIAQTAACNRLHYLEQRCCRWLLIAHDSARSDVFSVTHEFLAMMLGVHRPGISLALNKFQDAGMLTYVRGHVTIVDRRGLEDAACECYGTIRDEFDSLFARCS